jgi:hypothetical protein
VSRHLIRWDAEAQEWVVWQEATRVAAFSRLYEAERFVCRDAVIDLDEPAQVDR